MDTVLEFIVTIFISFVIILAVWLIYGRLVTPIKGGKGEKLYLVVCARGSTPDLSHTAKSLRWLRKNGRLDTDLIIADSGMDAESRKMAEIIARDCSEIKLCDLSELEAVLITEEECLKKTTTR